MSDDHDDPDLRRFERELEHREKNLEHANEMMKEAPEVLSELVAGVVIPLVQQLGPSSSRNQDLWNPPNHGQREEPSYQPDSPNNKEGPAKDVQEMRENLGLDSTENGGEEA